MSSSSSGVFRQRVHVRDSVDCAAQLKCEQGAPAQLHKYLNRPGESPVIAHGLDNHITILNADGDLLYSYKFSGGAHCVDADYCPFEDGSFGVVVAVNRTDKDEVHSLALLAPRDAGHSTDLLLLRQIAFKHQLTAVLVAVRGCEMSAHRINNTIFERMAKWEHIIVAGACGGHGYITHFGHWTDTPLDQQVDDYLRPKEVRHTDAIASFVERSGERECLVYDTDEGQNLKVDTRFCSVTALTFLDRGRIAMFGMYFGGMITVHLKTANMKCLALPLCAPIHSMSVMEPDDDPRPATYLVTAYDETPDDWAFSKGGPGRMVLSVCQFPDDDAREPQERKYEEPSWSARVLMELPEKAIVRRWVCVRTVERVRAAREEGVGVDTTVADESRKDAAAAFDRTLLLFGCVARTKQGSDELVGGIFDLNQYYYKRLPGTMMQDQTAARQCPFRSAFYLSSSKDGVVQDVHAVRDMWLNPSCMKRFTSNTSDADQMFFPSTYELEQVSLLLPTTLCRTSVESLPRKLFFSSECDCLMCFVFWVVSHIVSSLDRHMEDASEAAEWVRAIGLVNTAHTMMGGQWMQRLEDRGVVVRAVLLHASGAGAAAAGGNPLATYAKRCTNKEMIEWLSKWVWDEVRSAGEKKDEIVQAMFGRFAVVLPPASRKVLRCSADMFMSVRPVMDELRSAAERIGFDKETIYDMNVNSAVPQSLYSNVTLYEYLMDKRLLPANDEVRDMHKKIRFEIARRRHDRGGALWVDGVIDRLRSRTRDEDFWAGAGGAEQWYPPEHVSLVACLTFSPSVLPRHHRVHLLVYYLLDIHQQRPLYGLADMAEGARRSEYECVALLVEQSSLGRAFEMKRGEVEEAARHWALDAGQEKQAAISAVPCVDATREEEKELFNFPVNKLPPQQEKRLKELLLSRPYGALKWNFYLMKRQRYDEADLNIDLSKIPQTADYYDSYKKLSEYVRTFVRGPSSVCALAAGPRPAVALAMAGRDKDKELMEERERIRGKLSSMGSENRAPSVPVRPVHSLFSRPHPHIQHASLAHATVGNKTRNLEYSDDVSSLLQETTSSERKRRGVEDTPEWARDRAEEGETTPQSEARAVALERAQELLRTPKSIMKAGLGAGRCLDFDSPRTPERPAVDLPVPNSILKSAHKPSNMSPGRGRLRWNDELNLSALSGEDSPAVVAGRERGLLGVSGIKKPNFDSDSDADEKEDEISGLEKIDESVENETDMGEEEEEEERVIRQRSEEVQDEEEEEEQEDKDEEMKEGVVDDSLVEDQEEEMDVDKSDRVIRESVVVEQEEEEDEKTEDQMVTAGESLVDEEKEQMLEQEEKPKEGVLSAAVSAALSTVASVFSPAQYGTAKIELLSDRPLVDYSFADSTMCETPDRRKSMRRSERVITHRSFEQGDSDEDEKSMIEAEKEKEEREEEIEEESAFHDAPAEMEEKEEEARYSPTLSPKSRKITEKVVVEQEEEEEIAEADLDESSHDFAFASPKMWAGFEKTACEEKKEGEEDKVVDGTFTIVTRARSASASPKKAVSEEREKTLSPEKTSPRKISYTEWEEQPEEEEEDERKVIHKAVEEQEDEDEEEEKEEEEESAKKPERKITEKVVVDQEEGEEEIEQEQIHKNLSPKKASPKKVTKMVEEQEDEEEDGKKSRSASPIKRGSPAKSVVASKWDETMDMDDGDEQQHHNRVVTHMHVVNEVRTVVERADGTQEETVEKETIDEDIFENLPDVAGDEEKDEEEKKAPVSIAPAAPPAPSSPVHSMLTRSRSPPVQRDVAAVPVTPTRRSTRTRKASDNKDTAVLAETKTRAAGNKDKHDEHDKQVVTQPPRSTRKRPTVQLEMGEEEEEEKDRKKKPAGRTASSSQAAGAGGDSLKVFLDELSAMVDETKKKAEQERRQRVEENNKLFAGVAAGQRVTRSRATSESAAGGEKEKRSPARRSRAASAAKAPEDEPASAGRKKTSSATKRLAFVKGDEEEEEKEEQVEKKRVSRRSVAASALVGNKTMTAIPEDEEASAAVEAPPPTAKRGRGRPPKSQNIETLEVDAPVPATPATPTRRVGRPRKTSAMDVTVSVDSSVAAQPPPSTGRRTRKASEAMDTTVTLTGPRTRRASTSSAASAAAPREPSTPTRKGRKMDIEEDDKHDVIEAPLPRSRVSGKTPATPTRQSSRQRKAVEKE